MKIDYKKYPTLIPSLTISIMLFLAIPTLFPYPYYSLLRWTVFIGSLYISFKAYENDRPVLLPFFITIAILFNPLIPIYLSKDTWVIIDLIVGIIFLVSVAFIKQK